MECMNAVVCDRYGPPEVLTLRKWARPTPKKNEILVEVFASSVTNSDIFIRSAKVAKAFVIPFRLAIGITKPRRRVLGQVFAGKVAALGDGVTRFKVGDRVYGLTGFSLGAYGEYMAIGSFDSKRGCVSAMPGNVSYEDATSAAYGGLLAFQAIEKACVKDGDGALLYGAASTSGTIALQYLKSLGARVTAVCRSDKHAFIESLGADVLLDYTNEESIAKLETYDAMFDCVGKAKTSAFREEAVKHVASDGKIVSIDDGPLLLDSKRLERVARLVESGAIKPVTDRVFPLADIVAAHAYVERGRKTGNVAIRIKAE
jgi:NADPH:quinone reductase-like Zn-dependent oxidoreductase